MSTNSCHCYICQLLWRTFRHQQLTIPFLLVSSDLTIVTHVTLNFDNRIPISIKKLPSRLLMDVDVLMA